MTDQRLPFPQNVLAWLRAGYPDGVPRQDYVVLLGLLRRRLTEQEVLRISSDLADQAASGAVTDPEPISVDDIEALIHGATLQSASAEDVARVSARLASGGWPLADPMYAGDAPGRTHD